ncbi:MAG: tol-pal system-associated acyl-CoA thioesterase [Gammaproteobacteria bacterium]
MKPRAAGASGEFCWPVRIYYEDTDAAGIVYHANYLKFMERARTEWLRQIGYEQNALAEQVGILFVVRKIVIDYIKPARFNDEITVLSSVARLGRATLEFVQDIVIEDAISSQGRVKVGCIDRRTLRPMAIPADIYTEIANATG